MNNREMRDLKDIVPLETDMSLIGAGYRLPVLAVRVDLADLLFIGFNILMLVLLVAYITWRRMSAIRVKQIEIEVQNGLQVPFFNITRGPRKNKLKETNKQQLLEFKCEKCQYHQQIPDRHQYWSDK